MSLEKTVEGLVTTIRNLERGVMPNMRKRLSALERRRAGDSEEYTEYAAVETKAGIKLKEPEEQGEERNGG